VDGFISSSFAISSSVAPLGLREMKSSTRFWSALSVAGVSESAAAAEVTEPRTAGAGWAKSGPGVSSMRLRRARSPHRGVGGDCGGYSPLPQGDQCGR
jgi:hypothetical protein